MFIYFKSKQHRQEYFPILINPVYFKTCLFKLSSLQLVLYFQDNKTSEDSDQVPMQNRIQIVFDLPGTFKNCLNLIPEKMDHSE
jgi:hypothetical protein